MNRMTIKWRLLLAFGLLAATMLGIAALAVESLQEAETQLRGYVSGLALRAVTADEFHAAASRRAIAVRNMLLLPDSDPRWAGFARQAQSAHEEAQSKMAALVALAGPGSDASPQAREYVARLSEVERQYGPVALGIVADLKAGQREQAARKLAEACQPLLAQLEGIVADYHGYTRSRSDGVLAQALSRTASQRLLLMGVCAGAIGLALVAAYLVSRSIVMPIHAAVKLAESVAEGDLTQQLPVNGADEVAQLLGALSRMNGSLGEIVRTVRGSSDSIATGSGQIAIGNVDLSSRTERQASALQQTSATMRQLGDMVSRNAGHADAAKTLAGQASAAADLSDQAVRQVSVTMDAIRGSSDRVMTIISVIDGLAFRTNLLALNAAVEAARAGEQGRGFAIVAAEVRALARQSAEAAKEIAAVISESAGHVQRGVSSVGAAGGAMRDAVQAIGRVQALVADIADESKRQSVGVCEVGDAVASIDDVTQQNAALVEQSAAASESLNLQARLLSQVVAQFRVPAAALA